MPTSAHPAGLALADVVAALERIAPPALAEDWDNVGLIVEPVRPRRVHRVLLAIDLTPSVLDEALLARAELVVAYHPPLFHPIRRLAASDVAMATPLRALAARVAVYSPHTAADAAPGGVNDWLIDAFPRGFRRPLQPPRAALPQLLAGGTLAAPPLAGQGRALELERPAGIAALLARLDAHVGAGAVRAAVAERHRGGAGVQSIAACAGAGGDVVAGSGAELLVTGEWGHHHVLAALARGQSVALCGHSTSERGWLGRLAERLSAELGGAAAVAVARRDVEPLQLLRRSRARPAAE